MKLHLSFKGQVELHSVRLPDQLVTIEFGSAACESRLLSFGDEIQIGSDQWMYAGKGI